MNAVGPIEVLIILAILAQWLIPIVLIVLGIRWLMSRNDGDQRSAPAPQDTALEVLRQRYARGEIDAAEFEERKRTLGG
jgi:putative membrane protein